MNNSVVPYFSPVRKTCYSFSEGKVIPKSRCAKVAKWFLDKTDHNVGDVISYDEITYEVIELREVHDIVQAMLTQGDLFNIFHDDFDRILCGRDVFKKISNHSYPGSLLVTVDFDIGYQCRYRLCSVPVQFVPTMEGVILLPKVK